MRSRALMGLCILSLSVGCASDQHQLESPATERAPAPAPAEGDSSTAAAGEKSPNGESPPAAGGTTAPVAETSEELSDEAKQAAAKLKVENPAGYFSDAALQKALYLSLREETRNHLLAGHDAVWFFTSAQSLKNGSNYCWTMIGLTEPAPKGRASRIPAVRFSGSVRSSTHGPMNDDQTNACYSDALRVAIKVFAAASLAEQLDGVARTRGAGTRKSEPPSPSTIQLSWQGLSPAGKNALFDAIPPEFSKAFDYRRLQWLSLSDSYRYGDQVVCFSVAGVAARAPDDRESRFPGAWTASMWEMTPEESTGEDAEQRCRDTAALDAVRSRLDRSWDDQGLLSDFALAREDGVPPVTNYHPPKKPDPARVAAEFRKTIKVGTDSHCGLVIEIKPPIAKVQTMVGEMWLKTAQLYPKGAHDCRFVNGVYQDAD